MAKLTKEGYLNYLIDIKEKLRDFLAFIDKGRISYTEDITLKLRILFIRKSGTDPLFKTIQELYNFELKVKNVAPSSIKSSFSFKNGPVFWFINGSDKINIIDAFNSEKMVTIGEHHYSVKRIVVDVADQMGGAHIDGEVNDSDLLPHGEGFAVGDLQFANSFSNLNLANRIIYDTARQTIIAIEMIEEFLKTGVETEFIKIKQP